jgi:predicted PurR-regulated permease PerM
MISESPRPSGLWSDRRILVLVALSTLIVTAIWHIPQEAAYITDRTGELLFALTLSLAMTYVLRPIVNTVTRFTGNTRKGRSTATLITFVLVAVGLYLMFLIGFRPLEGDMKALVEGFWPKSAAAQTQLLDEWQIRVIQALEPYRSFLPASVFDNPNYFPEQISRFVGQIGGWLQHQGKHVGFLVELLLVPVLAFYFLSDGRAIRTEVRLLLPAAYRPRIARMAEHFDYVLDGYVRGQIWMCVIAWVLVTITLWALKVPHAVTLGLIAGLTRAIPVIGPLLGAIPLLLVCLFYTKSVETTSILLGGFTAMHFLESKVLLPKIVGHHVDLHPVSVILSLLIGMEFFGVIGVFLAVPIAAVLKIILTEFHTAQEEKVARQSGQMMPINSNPQGEGDVTSQVTKSQVAELS